MAIYTGFFDAAFHEETGKYDREYGAADFTGYFGEIVGSGVCVATNDDSMRVYYDSAAQRIVINSGYCFIRGYWLKNDALYTISTSGLSGTQAVCAELSIAGRTISITTKPKADPETYPDALVLAYVTVSGGSVLVEDTRPREDICGLIDAAGNLSDKIDYAIHYIDTEIESRLDDIEAKLNAKSDEIDAKIDEANQLLQKIAPPAIGTIRYSASQDIDATWLPCDGSFVSETQYPDLVAALGKLIPSGDKFQLLSDAEIGTGISNAVLYDGRLWVYSWAAKKLYGIDTAGEQPIKEIAVTSADPDFNNFQNPYSCSPIALSIVNDYHGKYKVFLSQITSNFYDSSQVAMSKTLVFSADMDTVSGSITLSRPFSSLDTKLSGNKEAIPRVISALQSDKVTYYMCTNSFSDVNYITWSSDGGQAVVTKKSYNTSGYTHVYPYMRLGFNSKNQNELVIPDIRTGTSSSDQKYLAGTSSIPNGVFVSSGKPHYSNLEVSSIRQPTMTPVASNTYVILYSYIENQQMSIHCYSMEYSTVTQISDIGIHTPTAAKVFGDAACYLWGKDIFMIFVGTGIVFSRTLQAGRFGYLDTTSVLGTITQGGYLDYSQDEGTLYIIGQDTSNRVKCAKIVLNTLYDYANDGAWLPLIAADGVPAYIKAKESTE